MFKIIKREQAENQTLLAIFLNLTSHFSFLTSLMPELPEVETTMRGLETFLTGRRLEKVQVRHPVLRIPVPPALKKQATGAKVKKLERRAKYILIHMDNGQTIIIHLGMSGRLFREHAPYAPEAHDHIIFETDSGDVMIYRDPRRFGLVTIAPTKAVKDHPLLRDIGPEPFDDALTPAALHEKLARRKMPIKSALLDQKIIAGLGNIYVLEALFHSRIHPERRADSLTLTDCKKLLPAIRKVLAGAIDAGGSSLRDYAHVDGRLGNFKNYFAVYGRAGKACAKCGTEIQRIAQGGRSSFFCPNCQK